MNQTDPYAAPLTSVERLVRTFVDNPNNPPHSIQILGHPYTLGDANRWAAFTNDELDTLSLRLADQNPYALYAEIHAELERRKDTP